VPDRSQVNLFSFFRSPFAQLGQTDRRTDLEVLRTRASLEVGREVQAVAFDLASAKVSKSGKREL
jgi:hypothetical protein